MVNYLYKLLNRGNNKLSSKQLEVGLNVFGAGWCAPCKLSKTLLKDQGIKFNELDMDEDSELFEKLNVRGIPTFVFVDDNNNVINTITGGIKPSDITDWYDNNWL